MAPEWIPKDIRQVVPHLIAGKVVRKHCLCCVGVQTIPLSTELDRDAASSPIFAEGFVVSFVGEEGCFGSDTAPDRPDVDWDSAVVDYPGTSEASCYVWGCA